MSDGNGQDPQEIKVLAPQAFAAFQRDVLRGTKFDVEPVDGVVKVGDREIKCGCTCVVIPKEVIDGICNALMVESSKAKGATEQLELFRRIVGGLCKKSFGGKIPMDARTMNSLHPDFQIDVHVGKRGEEVVEIIAELKEPKVLIARPR